MREGLMKSHRSTCIAATAVLGLVFAAGASAGNSAAPSKPTFTKDVAPILHKNCVACHQPGQAGPMSLRTYEEVRPWVKAIAKNVETGVMPPWHADPGYGPWKNDRSLSEVEKETILRWAKKGAAMGDPADMPEVPPTPAEGWSLGEPDYVITFDEMEVPGSGPDRFHDLIAKTDLPEDKWIKAVEILPGDREVVHHVILWQGDDERASGNPSGWIGAWAAGGTPMVFRDNTGRMLRKGATIIGDMHYHPAEDTRVDQTRVGFHFAENPEAVEKEMINLWVLNAEFEIPAGHENYMVASNYTFPQDSYLYSLTPHMHYRGKNFKYTLTYPDGEKKELLKVSDYDFNWQTGYDFETPLRVPAGSRLDCIAHFDNSAKNEDNPDPTKNVIFGNESYDEMMIGFVDYIVEEGIRPKPVESPVVPKAKELAQTNPGEVFMVMIPNGPGQGEQTSAIHMPKEGEGGWYVEFAGNVGRARIYEIAWTGSDFTAKAFIPGQGVQDLTGSVDAATGALTVTMADANGNGGTLTGEMVK